MGNDLKWWVKHCSTAGPDGQWMAIEFTGQRRCHNAPMGTLAVTHGVGDIGPWHGYGVMHGQCKCSAR